MPSPESFDHVAVLDATLTDLLAVKGIDYSSLPAAKKFDLRNTLMPTVNALVPHIRAQLEAAAEKKAMSGFVVPDTLEGLLT